MQLIINFAHTLILPFALDSPQSATKFHEEASMPFEPSPYLTWPRGIRISAYDEDMVLIDQSQDLKYDLNDNLFQAWTDRIVYLEVAVHSKRWRRWSPDALACIEAIIREDLEFDGNEFSLRRHTRKRLHPCTEGFVWRIHVY